VLIDKDELIRTLKQKQDRVNMNETIEERAKTIKKFIDGIDNPSMDMISMDLDTSNTPFLSSFLKYLFVDLDQFVLIALDTTQVFEDKLVCCPCFGAINKCWTGVLRKMGYRGNENY